MFTQILKEILVTIPSNFCGFFFLHKKTFKKLMILEF
jgi:hypothetical protein